MTSIDKYLELVFPIIEYCVKESQKKEIKKNHLWYQYRQIFYGFGMFFTGNYYSQEAELKFKELYKTYLLKCLEINKEPVKITIESFDWRTQPLIDEGRKDLLLEHMYSGTMFRSDIQNLFNKGILSIEEIKKLVTSNYKVCLIARSENQKLHKTQRGIDPIEYYSKNGITIINK
jgi:hypothetical protein